jgi:hypothetical protein
MPTLAIPTTINSSIADAAGDTDTNFGSPQIGEFKNATEKMRCVLYFDLSSIPAGSTILTSTLTLTSDGGNDAANTRTMRVYRILKGILVTEKQYITWNRYKNGSTWTTAGCSSTTSDRESTDIGSASVAYNITNNTVVSFTITPSKIQEMITGGSFTNNGFLMQMDTENSDWHTYYDMTVGNGTKRPMLTIEYSTYSPLPTFRNL